MLLNKSIVQCIVATLEPLYSGPPWDSLKCPDRGRCPHFRGVLIEGFHCICMHYDAYQPLYLNMYVLYYMHVTYYNLFTYVSYYWFLHV